MKLRKGVSGTQAELLLPEVSWLPATTSDCEVIVGNCTKAACDPSASPYMCLQWSQNGFSILPLLTNLKMNQHLKTKPLAECRLGTTLIVVAIVYKVLLDAGTVKII